MGPNNPWSDPNLVQPGFSLPVSIGPMALPPQKPKRRWRGILAWSLCVFAGGVAAGPPLVEYASQGVEIAANALAKRWPKLLGRYRPVPSEVASAPPRRLAQPVAPAPVAASPVAAPAPSAAPEPAPTQPAELPHARVAVSALPPSPPPPPPVRPARAGHARAARVAAAPAAPARKSAGGRDPFDTGGAAEEAAPAPRRAPEPAPSPRPATARSSDGLDSLLADAMTDTKGKSSSKKTSKDIDAMLKDVQKSEPAPAAKPRAQAELPPLSPADISKAMAGVKARSGECARRLGQRGVAELNLNVGKSGRVTDVTVGGKVAGTPLAACIEKAARAATFPPNAGLRFDYKVDAH